MVGATTDTYRPMGNIYTSTDAGATWTAVGPIGNWKGVATSSTGTKLVAVSAPEFMAAPGTVYTSIDAGAHWVDKLE